MHRLLSLLLVLSAALANASDHCEPLALNILLSTVREYTSEEGISDLEWIRRQEPTGTTGSNTVIDFRPSKRST